MDVDSHKIRELIQDIDLIVSKILKIEAKYKTQIEKLDSSFKRSAQNLIHYRALRTIDISRLQKKLGVLGLSSMASVESNVLSTLQRCRFILTKLIGEVPAEHVKQSISIKKAAKIQRKNAKNLLGYRSKGRRVRIMVTLPSEAATNYDLVHDLIEAGMNTARINCAHDDAEKWERMIENVVKAGVKLKKNCRISMDIAGPKIRTGSIEPRSRIVKFDASRNKLGKKVGAARIDLVAELRPGTKNELPVDAGWLEKLEVGDHIQFTDAAEKERTCIVNNVEDGLVSAMCEKTSYVETGTLLKIVGSEELTKVRALPTKEQALQLRKGDFLRILKGQIPGRPSRFDESEKVVEEAFISCTSNEIFEYVKKGEKILFNDGKIGGIIRDVSKDDMLVEINQAKPDGSNLRADKGINLPETNLKIGGLTDQDKEDLKFIVKHADVVNFSFVNSPEDVRELVAELDNLHARNKLGVLLKIETQNAYNNLTEILLEGMRNYPLGVMIARGDLAIEIGWENMARIQREILLLCNAAHVPDVWATQVLETLAKKGIPSRSEITDAATALNADCVMLNKGPYIIQALKLLDRILRSLNEYQDKNKKMYPVMEEASIM